MAAGLGFKTFTTGEVLTAADTNGYLMQGVLVFASAAARDAAITSPQEGQFAYLKDTNVTTYYTGSAWTNLDTTGMTNPMTTTGDMVYSSSGSTPARLGIGSTSQVLTVAGGIPSWATPASGGGMTLLSTTTLSGATTTISSISQDYVELTVYIFGQTNNTANGALQVSPNNDTTLNVRAEVYYVSSPESMGTNGASGGKINFSAGQSIDRTSANNSWVLRLPNYSSTTAMKPYQIAGGFFGSGAAYNAFFAGGLYYSTSAISSLVFNNSGGNHSAGTVKIYGVK